MSSLYEVPVNVELEDDSMRVYIKVFADNEDEAAIKAVAIAEDSVCIYSDDSDIIKI